GNKVTIRDARVIKRDPCRLQRLPQFDDEPRMREIAELTSRILGGNFCLRGVQRYLTVRTIGRSRRELAEAQGTNTGRLRRYIVRGCLHACRTFLGRRSLKFFLLRFENPLREG